MNILFEMAFDKKIVTDTLETHRIMNFGDVRAEKLPV
jgi:hypothetical protein